MPNFVTHRICAQGPKEDIARFIEQYLIDYQDGYSQRKKKYLDFDKIIPAPAILEETDSGSAADLGAYLLKVLAGEINYDPSYDQKVERAEGEDAFSAIKRFLEQHPAHQHYGQLQLQCFKETGFKDWYDWRIEHWGTKWGPCDGDLERVETDNDVSLLELTMDTAWSSPEPIFKKLAELFPKIEFQIICFDEGWGFAGEGSYNDPNTSDGLNYFTPFPAQRFWRQFYEQVYGVACPKFNEG
jgi:hypothetical protein